MAENTYNSGGEVRNHFRIALWGGAALLWLLPLLAMQFSAEMNWDETDFIVFGAMLLGACGAYELLARARGDLAYRAGAGIAIVAAFLLIWVNLAVGIIGSEDNPANLLYWGVLAVGIVGAAIARFRPGGMARALLAMALAQAAVGAVALAAGWGAAAPSFPEAIVVLTGFFAALWLLSAWLFRKAARDEVLVGSGAGLGHAQPPP